jgi:PAS domain S-box-containing protein
LDPLGLLLQAAFYVVFAISVWRWAARRGSLELAVVLVFAPIAGLFLISLLNSAVPAAAPILRPVLVGAFFLQPWFVVRLVDQIRPVAPRVKWLVLAGGLVSAGLVLVGPGIPATTLLATVFFFGIQAAAAGRLARESARRIGVARVRLLVAALSTAVLGLSILLAGAASAASGGDTTPTVLLITRSTALLAGVGYLLAFVPPAWLRRLAYRALAFDLVRNLVAPSPGVETGRLWADVAAVARQLLGARRVVILSERDGLPLASAGAVRDPPAPEPDPAAEPPDLVTRIGHAIASRPAIVSRIEVPLRDDRAGDATQDDPSRGEHLVAEIEGRPLFVEDDVALLRLLGGLTARAVDREEALVTLGQARSALEESAAIKASENRFRAFLEADPNAVLALDGHEAVVWATRQAGTLFGMDAQQLVGMGLTELINPPSELHPSGGSQHPVYRADTTGRRADGTLFPAEVARTSVEMDGQPFTIAVVSDVSWRHEAAQIRDRFLGVLSHELRTPVTSIYGGTQLLLGRGTRLDEATRTELLVSVAAESERLQRMIENLVALARIERGAEPTPARPVLLDRVIRDLIQRERRLWPEVTIRLDIPAPTQMVSADEEYLGQVVRNLLSNAAKYGGEGSTIEVGLEDGDGEVVVRVQDDGPGFTEEESDKLFGLYYRATTQAASAPGAGIGLFICRELVTLMGGRIWARPRQGGGAEFGFSLPAYVDEPDPSFVSADLPVAAEAMGDPAMVPAPGPDRATDPAPAPVSRTAPVNRAAAETGP